ncbi:hypothetical protein U1Q18_004676 [Sarracenia purpurea var. burkii]
MSEPVLRFTWPPSLNILLLKFWSWLETLLVILAVPRWQDWPVFEGGTPEFAGAVQEELQWRFRRRESLDWLFVLLVFDPSGESIQRRIFCARTVICAKRNQKVFEITNQRDGICKTGRNKSKRRGVLSGVARVIEGLRFLEALITCFTGKRNPTCFDLFGGFDWFFKVFDLFSNYIQPMRLLRIENQFGFLGL